MAKILEIKEPEKTVHHKDCGAVVAYYPNEMKSYQKSYYDGSTDTIYYIVCPNCGENIIINRY